MWKPRLAEASRPLRSPVIVTGPSGTGCSKVTVPPALESPLRTTTACKECRVSDIESVIRSYDWPGPNLADDGCGGRGWCEEEPERRETRDDAEDGDEKLAGLL